jgi:SAM-dependent methyltransferase
MILGRFFMLRGVSEVRKLLGSRADDCARSQEIEREFAEAFRQNSWAGKESRSGTGSDLAQTGKLIDELPALFRALGIRSVLDIPCGDFNWMRKVDLTAIDYTGSDILKGLVVKNQAAYGRKGIRFRELDVLTNRLPKVDLILCRDCFVHFSYSDIHRALRNIVASGSKYLLMTTFTDRTSNEDLVTGRDWRPLNFERQPFFLPPPLTVINE